MHSQALNDPTAFCYVFSTCLLDPQLQPALFAVAESLPRHVTQFFLCRENQNNSEEIPVTRKTRTSRRLFLSFCLPATICVDKAADDTGELYCLIQNWAAVICKYAERFEDQRTSAEQEGLMSAQFYLSLYHCLMLSYCGVTLSGNEITDYFLQ